MGRRPAEETAAIVYPCTRRRGSASGALKASAAGAPATILLLVIALLLFEIVLPEILLLQRAVVLPRILRLLLVIAPGVLQAIPWLPCTVLPAAILVLLVIVLPLSILLLLDGIVLPGILLEVIALLSCIPPQPVIASGAPQAFVLLRCIIVLPGIVLPLKIVLLVHAWNYIPLLLYRNGVPLSPLCQPLQGFNLLLILLLCIAPCLVAGG